MDSIKVRSKDWYQNLKGRDGADARAVFKATCCKVVLRLQTGLSWLRIWDGKDSSEMKGRSSVSIKLDNFCHD